MASDGPAANKSRILVLGASTPVGAEVVRTCALLGYDVLAADTMSCAELTSSNVKTTKLGAYNESELQPVLRGCETVIFALYSHRMMPAWSATSHLSNGARALRAAIGKGGAKRVIATSSAAIDDGPRLPWYHGHVFRRVDVNTYIDLARMETILEEGAPNIEFTIVRLPVLVTEPSKHFSVANRLLTVGQFRISVQDAAMFIVREIESRKWINAFPVPSYT